MGRKDRERRERIIRGEEEPIAERKVGILGRAAIKLATRGSVVGTLKDASTADQIEALDSTVGANKPSKLRKAIIRKAPREMDKAIKDFQKEGKPVTVDSLCAEIKSSPDFLSMCERVGLDLQWFENLAQQKMEEHKA